MKSPAHDVSGTFLYPSPMGLSNYGNLECGYLFEAINRRLIAFPSHDVLLA